MMTMRASVEIARAMATICCKAMLSVLRGRRTSMCTPSRSSTAWRRGSSAPDRADPSAAAHDP